MLLIDIGNTKVKWSFYSDDRGLKVHASKYAKTNIAGIIAQILANKTSIPKLIFCASVAETFFTQNLLLELKRLTKAKVIRVVSQSDFMGLKNAYSQPETLGVDRWLAMLAAHNQTSHNGFLLADMGSAFTLDFVDSAGHHLGGYIVPGVRMSLSALSKIGSLSDVTVLTSESLYPGRDTRQAVVNGLLNVFVSMLDRQAELEENCDKQRILTGGDADWIQPYLAQNWCYKPNIVLEGLALIASKPEIEGCFIEI